MKSHQTTVQVWGLWEKGGKEETGKSSRSQCSYGNILARLLEVPDRSLPTGRVPWQAHNLEMFSHWRDVVSDSGKYVAAELGFETIRL